MNKRKKLVDMYGPSILEEVQFLEPKYFDEALLGLGINEQQMTTVYSENCIIRLLMKHEKMSMDQAVNHFNTKIWHEGENVLFVNNEDLE